MPTPTLPLDLNLLVAVDALLEERSVTGAAARLHLSVPAASRTLARARAALGDPLLVRSGRELVPTPRALALQPRVRALLEETAALLRDGTAIDVSAMRRTFALRMHDAVTSVLGEALIARARREAPGVTLRFLPEGAAEESAALRDGTVDVEVGAIGRELAPDLRVERLGRDRHVGVLRAGHPLAAPGRRVTVQRFARLEHVLVSRRGRLTGPIDARLAERSLRRTVVASVGTVATALLLVRESDMTTTVSATLATRLSATFGLRVYEVPLPLDDVVYAQTWHARLDADPAHRWLRTCVRETIAAATVSAAAPRGRSTP